MTFNRSTEYMIRSAKRVKTLVNLSLLVLELRPVKIYN